MDRKIEKKRTGPFLKIAIAVFFLSGGYWLAASTDFSGNSLKLDKEKLRISEVKFEVLEDYIPIRGRIEPSRTVYLDAVEGGRVEEIFIEEGVKVEKGDVILRLSNTNLQLDVISREAQVSEQLNNLRNTRLAIEKEALSLKSELVEIDYQLTKLKRRVAQRKALFEKKLISEDDYLATEDELKYFVKRRELVIERQDTDKKVREVQLSQLESSVEQLQQNLVVARKNLDSLTVKAPVAGRLTALDVELGESKSRGQRFGQVDNLDNFKVSALVDEFYVSRISRGLQALAKVGGEEFKLEISKVYSQVTSGQFEVEMKFVNALPKKIRRGQTLSIKLQLDEGERVLVVDKGGFVQETGGNWVFVLSENGEVAQKKMISPGKSNPDFLEVKEGLSLGDKVVVSSYTGYEKRDKLIFN